MKKQNETDEKKKVRIENVEMRVIKWEKIWNDYRKKINGERERERESNAWSLQEKRATAAVQNRH